MILLKNLKYEKSVYFFMEATIYLIGLQYYGLPTALKHLIKQVKSCSRTMHLELHF